MPLDYIDSLYKNLPVPVLICNNSDDPRIFYLNSAARILLNPTLVLEHPDHKPVFLQDILQLEFDNHYTDMLETLRTVQSIKDYQSNIIGYNQKKLPVIISASVAEMEGGSYLIIYLYENPKKLHDFRANIDNVIAAVFHTAYDVPNANKAINQILSIVGIFVNASRAYIFEDIGNDLTRNTYEWCAEGIVPAIDRLQNLHKDKYPYQTIVNAGVFVSDDVRLLPKDASNILTAQGIQSLAIIALYRGDNAVGFIGFDDCEGRRRWKSEEINLLRNVASIVVSLITRRNSEEKAKRSNGVLQIISDNIDSIVYVSSIADHSLKFVNEPMANICGQNALDMIGKECWHVLHLGQSGPCDFCPMKHLISADGTISTEPYLREFQNTYNNRWYLIRSAIIKWTDGEWALIETGTEITHQKQYQEQLEFYASTDMMTGTFNREWGYKILGRMISEAKVSGRAISLCFIDMDGLKQVNDTYGHDMGDAMITETINAIRTCIRHNDVICRWGGDEFILILECDTKAAARIMEKVESAIAKINATHQRPYNLAFSHGITNLTNEESQTIDTIISRADKLMYDNKMKKSAFAKNQNPWASANEE